MSRNGHRRLLVLLFLGSLFAPLPAEKPEEVINPRRAGGGFVADGGGVLAPEYVRLIDGVCRDLQAKTTVELAVVTVGDLGGLPIEDFAVRLFKRFAIGAAGKDNGLLLLCSRDDRTVRLEVGYGLEGDIPDALASRLLERGGLPHLKAGFFGRGLFMAVRDIAGTAATAAGKSFFIAEPTAWPAEAVPPKPLARAAAKKKKGWDPLLSSLYFGAGLLGFAALGLGWTLLRFDKARGKAARSKAIGGAKVPTILAWIAAVISFFFILGFGGRFLPPFVAMLAAPGLATASQVLTSRFLRRRLASYRLPCRKCGAAMEMVDDSLDEKFLSAEQAAEEKAGGMDYEFWHCPKCGAEESLATKLGKASKCPQCKRRSLTSSYVTMVAATKEQGGKARVIETCLNPTCNYSKIREHSTPRLSSPGPSSSGASRSHVASFGGGRSGGGGASKKF
ncbi:MAG: TPM domain-containing protein [Acidobacteriota bacterium]|nr:TPM domain-containing protein [Acidobacteriota bacterium]